MYPQISLYHVYDTNYVQGIAMLPNTVSELFIKSYNKAVEEVLIPEMNNILVVECRRIDVALTNASQSVTRGGTSNNLTWTLSR